MRNTEQDDCIRLSFPVNAAYVSSARLTASSIANRMGFDIDEIEDVKTAVSEACTYIIKTWTPAQKSHFEICFRLQGDVMEINIVTQGKPSDTPLADEISLMMIRALVDACEIDDAAGDSVVINMIKKHKASIFG